ncbi:MAG: HEAT repeat domain-containing protein [Planctomycetota bacterium]|nr:HEAT repeat domain-containing protein [Planctomycetota bacterium]
MRILIPLLGLLLIAGGLRALLGDDGTEVPPPSDMGLEPEAPGGPSLEGSGSAGVAGQAEPQAAEPVWPYRPLPAAAQEQLGQPWDPHNRMALRDWVMADKRRYLDLLFHRAAPAKRDGRARDRAEAAARRVVASWNQGGLTYDLRTFLTGVLREPGHAPAVIAGVLETLRLHRGVGGGLTKVLREMVQDERRQPSSRARAARLLLETSTPDAPTIAALRALLESPMHFDRAAVSGMLMALNKHPDVLRALVPQLLARARRQGPASWTSRGLLRALLASGDRSDEALNVLAQGSHNAHGALRKDIAAALYGREVGQVLAWMEQAAPRPRIVGVHRLNGRGVAKERLRPHLLAVLASTHTAAVQIAVDTIPLLAMGIDETLPVLEQHLRGESYDLQAVAVKALGSLAAAPGDGDAVVQRLLVLARSPEFPRLRILAVQAVLMHEAKPAAVIEVLAALLDDSEAPVRREAVDALGELAGEHAAARTALEGARNDGDEDVRALIAYWLDETDDD